MSDLSRLSELLNKGIEKNIFSGAQLWVSDPDKIIVQMCAGTTRSSSSSTSYYQPSLKIDENTLFDIASLTKPLSTASLVMKAVDENMIQLDQKLVSISGVQFPLWCLGDTIEQLLSHRTMLPAWADFHHSMPRLEERRQTIQHFERVIMLMEPRDDNNSWCYSDLGYMLLGFILESIYQTTQEELFVHKISRPLGLDHDMCYRPLHQCSQKMIAATCPYAGSFIQGHPDDANARALAHIAGHAGLFASAKAVDTYVRALISHHFVCKPETIDRFLNYRHIETPFALGWDRPTSENSLSGRKPGDPVIGHLGFTGCSVWVDMETGRIVTFLTNRTHCNSEPSTLGPLRRKLHAICWGL